MEWIDEVKNRIKRGRIILFDRDSQPVAALYERLCVADRRAVVTSATTTLCGQNFSADENLRAKIIKPPMRKQFPHRGLFLIFMQTALRLRLLFSLLLSEHLLDGSVMLFASHEPD